VINGREYAYGGHDRRGATGVYWTKPKTEPPGGRYRCSILHGFSFATAAEIDVILRDASDEFQGTSYNLLTKNCNHFTSHLCRRLTGRAGPGWLNRAASIGVALPCVVPRDWIEPPEYDTADGELLLHNDEDDDNADERSGMLGSGRSSSKPPRPRFLAEADKPTTPRRSMSLGQRSSISSSSLRAATSNSVSKTATSSSGDWDSDEERRRGGTGKGKKALRDTSGRELPAAERAPET
jgi:hypothetical protein